MSLKFRIKHIRIKWAPPVLHKVHTVSWHVSDIRRRAFSTQSIRDLGEKVVYLLCTEIRLYSAAKTAFHWWLWSSIVVWKRCKVPWWLIVSTGRQEAKSWCLFYQWFYVYNQHVKMRSIQSFHTETCCFDFGQRALEKATRAKKVLPNDPSRFLALSSLCCTVSRGDRAQGPFNGTPRVHAFYFQTWILFWCLNEPRPIFPWWHRKIARYESKSSLFLVKMELVHSVDAVQTGTTHKRCTTSLLCNVW